MTATTPIAVATAILAMALAGCTGGFQVDQTEPFRIQLEGAPETVTVRETDADPQRVEIATCGEEVDDDCAEQVDVKVEAKALSGEPCTLLVTIQDESGNTLATRTIEVNVDVDVQPDGDDGTTTGNDTTNGTTTTETETQTVTSTVTTTAAGGSGDTVIQNIVVNVKGAKNIVVLTQAQEGSADVDISAVKASGNADVDIGDDDDEDSSSGTMTTADDATSSPTGSSSASTSESGTTTSSSGTTTGGP